MRVRSKKTQNRQVTPQQNSSLPRATRLDRTENVKAFLRDSVGSNQVDKIATGLRTSSTAPSKISDTKWTGGMDGRSLEESSLDDRSASEEQVIGRDATWNPKSREDASIPWNFPTVSEAVGSQDATVSTTTTSTTSTTTTTTAKKNLLPNAEPDSARKRPAKLVRTGRAGPLVRPTTTNPGPRMTKLTKHVNAARTTAVGRNKVEPKTPNASGTPGDDLANFTRNQKAQELKQSYMRFAGPRLWLEELRRQGAPYFKAADGVFNKKVREVGLENAALAYGYEGTAEEKSKADSNALKVAEAYADEILRHKVPLEVKTMLRDLLRELKKNPDYQQALKGQDRTLNEAELRHLILNPTEMDEKTKVRINAVMGAFITYGLNVSLLNHMDPQYPSREKRALATRIATFSGNYMKSLFGFTANADKSGTQELIVKALNTPEGKQRQGKALGVLAELWQFADSDSATS